MKPFPHFPLFPLRFVLPMALFGVVLSGCSGGGTKPNPPTSGPITIENYLSNTDFYDSEQDRYYDIYVCDPLQSGLASVDMTSDDVDSYLLIYRKDSSGNFDLIEQDDDDGEGADAAIDFSVERNRSYRIVTTSAHANERGLYRVRFSEELGRPARVLPDASRTASRNANGTDKSFKLPPFPAKAAKPTKTTN